MKFQLLRIKFGVVMKQFKLNILILLSSKLYWLKGIDYCFYSLYPKKINVGMHLWTSLVQTGYGDKCYWTLQFDTSLNNRPLFKVTEMWENKHTHTKQKQQKTETLHQLSHKFSIWFGWKLVWCCSCAEPYVYFILSDQQARNRSKKLREKKKRKRRRTTKQKKKERGENRKTHWLAFTYL